MRTITRLAAAVAACFACSAASALQPVVLQWQTANLTESPDWVRKAYAEDKLPKE